MEILVKQKKNMIKRRNSFLTIMLFAFFCNNGDAQKIVKLPFYELIVENKIIYNDSITFNGEQIVVTNCDSMGSTRDTTTGIFLFVYGEFKLILDARVYFEENTLNCIKIDLKKMENSKWNKRLSKKEKRINRRLHITNRCTSNVSTAILIKNKLHHIRLEKF
jgi:hypothetical protein